MECRACRAVVPDGSRFCASCGKPLTSFESAASPATAPADDVTRAAPGPAAVPGAGYPTVVPGATIAGRYQIVRQLGQGGMGVVFQADDLRLGHPVALKFLPPALARDARRLAQFHSEVSLSRQVSHPNVCRVYDIGDVDGHPFLSMEHIEGEDLAAALQRRGPFPEGEAVELIRQICSGLTAVHERGVLHRDLKPANVMLNAAGQAQLMDFGIATMGDRRHLVEGTPAYMAPEQLRGERLSVQTDIYALGLVMHELVTGRRAVNDRGSLDVAAAGGVSPPLQEAILRCLEPDPQRRPASAQAVSAMLQTVLLDVHTWRHRIAHFLFWIATAHTLAMGLNLLLRRSALVAGAAYLAGFAALIVIVLRYTYHWEVTYKGHAIRFEVHSLFGERLYIDGRLVDSGRIGMRVTLRGTIESGVGAGDRISAQSRAGFLKLSCRIVAESFAG